MPQNNDAEFDRRLRDYLEPKPAAVERLVQGALLQAFGPKRTHSGLFLGMIAATAIVVVVLLFVHFQNPEPETLNQPGLNNPVEVVLLQSPSGENWIFTTGASGVQAPPGTGLIIIEGDSK